jgi:hypothetical protein
MQRGRVIPDAAVAWLTGRVTAGVYFATARQRAAAGAARAVGGALARTRRAASAAVALPPAARNERLELSRRPRRDDRDGQCDVGAAVAARR